MIELKLLILSARGFLSVSCGSKNIFSIFLGGDPSETIPMQSVGPNTPSRSSCTAATAEPASDSVALL